MSFPGDCIKISLVEVLESKLGRPLSEEDKTLMGCLSGQGVAKVNADFLRGQCLLPAFGSSALCKPPLFKKFIKPALAPVRARYGPVPRLVVMVLAAPGWCQSCDAAACSHAQTGLSELLLVHWVGSSSFPVQMTFNNRAFAGATLGNLRLR